MREVRRFLLLWTKKQYRSYYVLTGGEALAIGENSNAKRNHNHVLAKTFRVQVWLQDNLTRDSALFFEMPF